ncbi:protein cycle [Lingula anatina]|uniref:Protein cycle n=1 Tax=Lingula anatina TaxID=7574 RepID=A0A1S3H276_LINAN|nr:protein cycle [Lingula anatina]XP_013380048.1 protein cycle [Lingula anatina]|eukprot:XP_013380047.1 protein cycle [Lingula anatina]
MERKDSPGETFSGKRKVSSVISYDSDLEDDGKYARTDGNGDRKRFSRSSSITSQGTSVQTQQNHSEIEKRRRDKMNAYIWELSSMIPMCSAMNRKLDKLTVLRMAVQHIKSLKGADTSQCETSQRPAFLSDEELKHLILKSAGGFLFVVACDRGKLLYVSESVKDYLNFTRSELTNQSLFDILHPKDITKVKEQLTSSDLTPRERLIDAKTMMPVKTEMPQIQSQFSSGARRCFFCRMKCGVRNSGDGNASLLIKEEKEQDIETVLRRKKSDRCYALIHCTGYLKSWPPAKLGLEEDTDSDSDGGNTTCLVAVGKVQPVLDLSDLGPTQTHPTEFVSRHAIDGKFTYVDQRATAVLGYLPQELLGTSVYEYYHQDDLAHMAEIHKKVLAKKEKVESGIYHFRLKDGSFISLRTTSFAFISPWTKDIEYIVATHTVEHEADSPMGAVSAEATCSSTIGQDDSNSGSNGGSSISFFKRPEGRSPSTAAGIPLSTKTGAGRIGRLIADEVLEQSRKEEPISLHDSLRNELHSGLASLRLAFERAFSTTCATPVTSTVVTSLDGQNLPSNNMAYRQAAAVSSDTDNTSVVSSVDERHSNSSSASTGRVPQNGMSSLAVRSSATESPTPGDNLVTSLMDPNNFSELSSPGDTGNDEAAMAVIMSLLEADAGLGGPVDFSDLPWPL